MCRSVISLLVLFTAAAAPVQTPAVIKMLNLFQALQTSQYHDSKHVSFFFTESELNEYLSYSLQTVPRPGIRSVTVKVFASNYISTFTVVDFDAIERWKPGAIPGLLRPVLNGKKAIWLDVRFQAKNGTAAFSVEKAYFQSIRLPAFFVEKMIQIVAARQPEKYDTNRPLPLPFGLRQVSTKEHLVTGEN
ncbi:MAG: hypothetical protein ABSF62_10350 [Bryobacteraceae bacterium]